MTSHLVRDLPSKDIAQAWMADPERSAAHAENDALMILNQAFHQNPRSQKEIAQALGVTEGRVSQVLNGNGNLRISTVARYLSAMGFVLRIEADASKEHDPTQLGRRFSRKSKDQLERLESGRRS